MSVPAANAFKVLSCLLVILAASCAKSSGGDGAAGGGSGGWSYHGNSGPDHWADISPDYAICRSGLSQSPIDFSGRIYAEKPDTVFYYKATGGKVVNDGNAVKFIPLDGGYVDIDGKKFAMKWVTFHTPSEHHVDGAPYAMEAQILHQADDGTYTMVGVFFEEGYSNAAVTNIWEFISSTTGEEVSVRKLVDLAFLLSFDRSYYRYSGSLSTPPCTENILWTVLERPIGVTAAQVEKLRELVGENVRPIQPLNGRKFTYVRQ